MFWIAVLLGMVASLPALGQGNDPARQPCNYFEESMVRAAFSIPAAQKLERTEKATCRFAFAAVGGASQRPSLQSVSLNFMPGTFAPNRIDQLFNRMKNGYTGTVRDREVVIAPKDVEWVSGVGDKAFWNNDLSQLAVSARNQLFYVTVTLSDLTKEQKVEAAKKAASSVIARL
ncbi:MAG: hypothetical protein KIT83_21965 [Bryobacterales bacterium]|nr:hypothetical protein [Bryobacterales bacterium]